MVPFSSISNTTSRIVSPIIVCFTVLFFCQADVSAFYEHNPLTVSAYSSTEFDAVIGEYQTQVDVLDKQIKGIQKDLDWLIIKINRISDSGRKVLYHLKTSVTAKKERIAKLQKEKSSLLNILAGYQAKKTASTAAAPKIKSSTVKPAAQIVKVPDASRAQGKIPEIQIAVKKAGLEDWVEVLNADGGCAKINNTLPILFSSGSAALSKSYKPFLKKLAYFLKSYDVKIYVNGFADSDPIHTKRYPSNFELAASRAANVVHEMVRYGLKPAIFKIGTTGEHRFEAKTPSQKKSFQRRAQVTVVFSS